MSHLRTRPWWKVFFDRQANRKQARTTPRRVRLTVEALEVRDVPANTISGTVMETLNVAGLFPDPTVSPLFKPITDTSIKVLLDNALAETDTVNGAYTFMNVTAGTHTVSIVLPDNYIGFNAQSLSYTLKFTAGTDFPNLNFALTPRNGAVVQNLYELVLQRSADFNGYNAGVDVLDNGGKVSSVFNSLYKSPEFAEVVKPVAGFLQAFFPGPLAIGPLRHSVELQNLGISQDATILGILYSEPFVAEYGDTSQLSNTDYVRFLYDHLLNRNPSRRALAGWVAELDNGMNRGELALEIVGLRAFQRRAIIQRPIGVSLAFLGVLGREATAAEVRQFRRTSLTRLVNRLTHSAEFESLTGYTDTFFWDVKAHAARPAVDVLSRLQIYNPATQAFDIAVTHDSITSTSANPKNVYFVAHGWAPGLLEPVLLGSTADNPLKSWQTAGTDNPDPVWLYEAINQVSAEGLAQAIIDADPRALVVAFSWIDLSATALGNDNVTLELTATTNGSTTLTVDASQLGVGMSVTGPGIPAGTTVSFINSQTSVILSQAATTSQAGVKLIFSGPSVAKGIEQFLYAGQSGSRTQWAGLLLADAIHAAISPGFFTTGKGLIHILGHSHGSKVATVATLALQELGVAVSHLTLLESPEGGPTFADQALHAPGLGGAENFNWHYLKDLTISKTPITGDRQATGGTFVDNYYSQEGFGSAMTAYAGVSGFESLGEVVDVLLHPEDLYGSLSISDVQQDATILFGSHGYPPPWYGQASLQNPSGLENTLNGLYWSPLIDPATTADLEAVYEQKQQTTPGEFIKTQFELNPPISPPSAATPEFSTLVYAQQSSFGQVADDGAAITLTVDAANPLAIDTITFTPLGFDQKSGAGVDFEFAFSGVTAGEHVELVIWVHGMASVPQDAITKPLGNTLGYISIPLFSMDGVTAGAGSQSAPLSLDAYRVGLLLGPFNSVINISSGSQPPLVPILGFSLITADGSDASVTVTNLRQFHDGIS